MPRLCNPFQHILKVSCLALLLGLGCTARADLLISNVTLIDGTGRAPISGVSVLVVDDRIQLISRQPISSRSIKAARNATRIDGGGQFLIPGLIDTHIHLRGGVSVTRDGLNEGSQDNREGIQALHGYLYSGVTSVYDAGNKPDYIFALRQLEREGGIQAPRIFTTGGIVTYPGSHGSGPGAYLVEAWPAAQTVLESLLQREPDMLKMTFEERGWGARPMVPLLPLDLMREINGFANDRGIRTVVHTSSEYRARQAIFAGADALAHPVIQGPISESFGRLMAAKQIPMATTLTIGENYSRLAEHPEFLDQPLYRAVLDVDEIEEMQTVESERRRNETWTWWMKLMTPVAQENLRQIHAAGGVLALGTDHSSGPAVHREMELLVAAGIEPIDVIRIATLNGAMFLGRAAELGSVEEGKLADLVLLAADPRLDIDNAKHINAVIKAGKLVDRAALQLPVNN